MIKINNSSTSNMESHALSPEIRTLKDMLDKISTANQSTLNALGGTLTTVMGTAVTTGAPTATNMLAILEAADILPKQNRAGNALRAGESYNRSEILTKLSELLATQATTEAQAMLELAKGRVMNHLTNNANPQTQTAIDKCIAEIPKLSAARTTDPSTQAERDAKLKYESSIKIIKTNTAQMQAHDKALAKISAELDDIYMNKDTTDAAVSTRLDQLQAQRKNIYTERKYKKDTMIEHFGQASDSTSRYADKIELSIPKDLKQGKGQIVIDNTRSYLRTRAAEYYAILPQIHRTFDDYNSSEGTYWQPPAMACDIDASYRSTAIEQGKSLAIVIKSKTPTDIFDRITSTFNCGKHDQIQVKCDATDGPALLFALISLYKPAKATHQDKLTSDFNNAWTHFTKGDPKNKINHLRPKLNEAIDLKIQLNWSTTGKKIVQVLSRNDHVMSQKLKKFENGPNQPEDTNAYLQDLFAAIETQVEDDKAINFESKGEKQWHANNATGLCQRDNADGIKECKFGDECYSKNCRFGHPGRGGASRSRYSDRKGKSKGKGGKGKGRGKGNGGKHKPVCDAEGCSQYTPHPSKILCTTCFKTVIDKGSITRKDGTKFELRNKIKTDNKTNYGFSAQQIEGLRLFNQATVYKAEGLETIEGEAAPAGVKRRRIQERLGNASSAQAQQEDTQERTRRFLEAIDINNN